MLQAFPRSAPCGCLSVCATAASAQHECLYGCKTRCCWWEKKRRESTVVMYKLHANAHMRAQTLRPLRWATLISFDENFQTVLKVNCAHYACLCSVPKKRTAPASVPPEKQLPKLAGRVPLIMLASHSCLPCCCCWTGSIWHTLASY